MQVIATRNFMLIQLFLFCSFCCGLQTQAQDINHYNLTIALNDTTNKIQSTAKIKICHTTPTTDITLDLITKDKTGGMQVAKITSQKQPIKFKHKKDKLTFKATDSENGCNTYTIHYSGIPKDGLIISENKHGDRTFFGDNWPNRAHHWFPCIDHPSDKATYDWVVTAPAHYQVVASGTMIEETDLPGNRTLYHWHMDDPISTKVAVIGVARFAVQHLGEIKDIPVSSWVYPQDRDAGFYDYALAVKVMDYFIEHIGPYPFDKIANVQSKTRFGGMENASNIFYSENSITGERKSEGLIAHELAHQWFGNSATESDWPHIWLSEGFATYMTDLYMEHMYGHDNFIERIKNKKRTVIQFAGQRMSPVVDTETTDYMKLLNANSYQKGALVLHMLRHEVGDEDFWKILRSYYDRYKYANASSQDFRQVAEEVTKKELGQFFQQWLFIAGHPKLKVDWNYENEVVVMNVAQQNDEVFHFDMDVEFTFKDGTTQMEMIHISEQDQTFRIDVASKPVQVELDPGEWLLFELQG